MIRPVALLCSVCIRVNADVAKRCPVYLHLRAAAGFEEAHPDLGRNPPRDAARHPDSAASRATRMAAVVASGRERLEALRPMTSMASHVEPLSSFRPTQEGAATTIATVGTAPASATRRRRRKASRRGRHPGRSVISRKREGEAPHQGTTDEEMTAALDRAERDEITNEELEELLGRLDVKDSVDFQALPDDVLAALRDGWPGGPWAQEPEPELDPEPTPVELLEQVLARTRAGERVGEEELARVLMAAAMGLRPKNA